MPQSSWLWLVLPCGHSVEAKNVNASCLFPRPVNPHLRRLTFLTGLSPPPKDSGSTVLYPADTFLLLLSLRIGLCSSITSTMSSSGGRDVLLVSSMITVSLSLLGGSLLGGVRSRLLSISITSLAEWLDGGRRGDDLRADDLVRECRCSSTISSRSTTSDEPIAPPMPKHVYMSHNSKRKPATEPKTIPTTVPGEGPAFRPE